MVFMPHGLGISSANQRAAHNQRSKSSGYIRPSHCHANHEWGRSQGPPCHQWQDPKSLSHKYHVTHRQTDRDTDNRTRNKMADQTKLKTQDWTWTNRKQRSWNNRNIYILVSLTSFPTNLMQYHSASMHYKINIHCLFLYKLKSRRLSESYQPLTITRREHTWMILAVMESFFLFCAREKCKTLEATLCLRETNDAQNSISPNQWASQGGAWVPPYWCKLIMTPLSWNGTSTFPQTCLSWPKIR